MSTGRCRTTQSSRFSSFHIGRTRDPFDRAMVLPADRCSAFWAVSELHRHSTITDRELFAALVKAPDTTGRTTMLELWYLDQPC